MDDFWRFYDSSRVSLSFDVNLFCDLNFTAESHKMEHPLGLDTLVGNMYSGAFNGNGHTISGLNMTLESSNDSYAGFFYALGNATVRDLHFDSSCVFDGTWAGALAAYIMCADGTYIFNVSSAATVRSSGVAGGLIGSIECTSSPTNVTFESCTNTGSISVVNRDYQNQVGAGGIVGVSTNFGSAQKHTLSFKNCRNTGSISTTITGHVRITEATAGGIVGGVNASYSSSLTFESCTNNGAVRVVVESDAAFSQITPPILASGIGSFVSSGSTRTIVMSRCHNLGAVSLVFNSQESLKLHTSGLLSVMGNASSEGQVKFTECTNSGRVSASSLSGNVDDVLAAGISTLNTTVNSQVRSCCNTGDVTSTGTVCGIVHSAYDVYNNAETGNLQGEAVYGIARKASTTNYIVSIGDISGTKCFSSFLSMPIVIPMHIYFRDIANVSHNGVAACKNESTGRWMTCTNSKDIVDILNDAVSSKSFSMWWTSNLTLGHHVTITGNNLPPLVTELGSYIVAEHGETLRNALEREGLGQFLDGSYVIGSKNCAFSGPIVRDCSMNVVKVHALVFVGVVNQTIYVVYGRVPTNEILEPISQFINNKAFIITLTTNNTVFFNASAPVTSDASYIIKKTASVEVIIDDGSGLTDEEIIGAIIGEISDNDPTTVVQVVDIIREDDGSVVVRVSVEEDKAESAVVSITESDNTILRRVRRAYIVIDLSTSSSSLSFLSLLSFFLSLLFLF